MRKIKSFNPYLINTLIVIGIILLIASLILMMSKNTTTNHIVKINYDKYQEIIKEDKYNVVLLTLTTCEHCKSYKNSVNKLADDYNLTVYELSINDLNIEEYIEVHDKYKATKDTYSDNSPSMLTPVTIIVKNNEEINSVTSNIGYYGLLNLLQESGVIKK